MADTFKFELVSPERILLSVDAEEVVVPGAEGEFTVLPGHAPVIAQLAPGVLSVKLQQGRKNVFVRSGFADVTPSGLTILAERAFVVEEADARTVERELDMAQKALDDAGDDEARMHVNRAIEQLRAIQSGKVAA
ncbi:MAG: F0F1 ATP synthase subunit epsilon [Hyphomicrobiaceae bacterium]|nr:F0F1 ATP synthase subunit epsilon [Hyphomicrobiaceae bacterium]